MDLTDLRERAEEISEKIKGDMGDMGSCVLGFNLRVDGEVFIPQPVQGSSTCSVIYIAIEDMLIENGIDKERITIDHGVMD